VPAGDCRVPGVGVDIVAAQAVDMDRTIDDRSAESAMRRPSH